jgi:hypothetical protein
MESRMTDAPPGSTAQAQPVPDHRPFPLVRVLYAIGFAFLAWVVLWIVFVLAAVQVAVLVINGHTNDELKRFSLNLLQYLFELLAFVIFARDDLPFPIGPFPSTR